MITILIPIYNGMRFLPLCIKSIKKQTYTKWLVLIGINGHPPNSILYNYAKKYESDKIKVLDLVGIKGKSNALNEMIKYVKTPWISLLDVDDLWTPKKLEKQIRYTKKYDVIGTMCKYFGDRHDIPKIPIGNISSFDFFKVNPIINSSCLVKKELCYWNFEFEGIEDYDMWLRLRKQNKRFYNVGEILVYHRIHNESSFNSKGNHLHVKKIKKKYR